MQEPGCGILCGEMSLSRRQALGQFWGLVLGSPLLRAQAPAASGRFAPLAELINAEEFRGAARSRLSRPVFERIAAAAGAGRTLERNRSFFERITFRPRMLVDVSRLNLQIELFGDTHFTPILAGPTARHERVHPEGEAATAAGCSAAKTAMVLSERSSRPLAEVAAATELPLWLQVSPADDLGELRARIQEGVEQGARAVVLTLDARTPRLDAPRLDAPRLDVDARGGPPALPSLPSSRAAALDALRAAKAASPAPVIVKGILSASDASSALAAGADGLVVSNHGGRSVDGAPATIEALPAVAEAVAGRAPLLIDGGFRRGSDILKALALGADAVLLGRPILWALAAYGAPGVQRLLELLQSELALAMGLSGTPRVVDAGPALVKLRRW